MKKVLALSIAGAAAVVVAGWRRIQRDNEFVDDIDEFTGDAVAVAPGVPAEASPATPDLAVDPPSKPSEVRDSQVGEVPSHPTVNESSSKAELYEAAQELDIEGRSKMTKAELLEAIRKAG